MSSFAIYCHANVIEIIKQTSEGLNIDRLLISRHLIKMKFKKFFFFQNLCLCEKVKLYKKFAGSASTQLRRHFLIVEISSCGLQI